LGFKHKRKYYNLSEILNTVLLTTSKNRTGINSQLNFAETSGKYRYNFGADINTKTMITMT
jgi:hypothetical protein